MWCRSLMKTVSTNIDPTLKRIGLQWLSELQLANENNTKEIFLTFENNPFENFV